MIILELASGRYQMQNYQGILITLAIVIAALIVYDKWVKGKV